MNKIKEILNEIQDFISVGDFKNGKILIDEYKKNFGSSDEIESMEAIINIFNGNYENALINIREGLRYNLFNSDLYYTMGNIYEALGECNRAYLCYEQSLYLCNNEDNKKEICNSIDKIKNNNSVSVNNVSFIILTYNQLDYTKLCINSIRKYCNKDTYEIIIVDNHSTDGTVEWLKMQEDIKTIFNNDNKGFPIGCNQGIRIANKNNDIMLLNNDTILMANSIFNLRMALYSKKDIGATGAVSNNVTYLQAISEKFNDIDEYEKYALNNNITNELSYEEVVKLIGFAMLIKRNVLEKTGYLDERFTPGNYEDDDISLRIIMEGYKLLISKDSFIYHFGNVSFINIKGGYNNLLEKNEKKFEDKWGFLAIEKEKVYKTILNFINEKDKNILEINAGSGSNLVSIRNKFNDRRYYSYEKNHALVEVSRKLGINILDNLGDNKYSEFFNLIIITEYNIIENSKLLLKIKKILNSKDGRVIIVLDAYKEKKDFFLNSEIEKFINIFLDNNYKMIDCKIVGKDNEIVLCTILFDNINKYTIKRKTLEILSKGQVTKASNYLTMLENENTYNDTKSIRKELNDKFKILNKIKFLLRRVDIKKDENIQELFDIIEKNEISDDCIIEIVNENIINKNNVLNYMAIQYFASKKFDRILPYLKKALLINTEDKDTIYNLAYMLNYFGEKEKALEFLKNIKNKDEGINKLIVKISKGK